MTYAKVIADSISQDGDRLTTFEVCFHRFVLAEFNTHRVFSRNSASSRAIPLHKQIDRVAEGLAYPVSWPREQKGMQGGDEFGGSDRVDVIDIWQQAGNCAVEYAERLGRRGLHKSVVNRLLEPFMRHTAVVSSTAWSNFFKQRCSPLAQPEIRVAAEMMKEAYDASTPLQNYPHAPYVDMAVDAPDGMLTDTLMKISAARCARVSYLTQDGQRDIQADLALYDRLVTADPMHASPLEHVAVPCSDNKHEVNIGSSEQPVMVWLPKYGNFLGWRQLRFDVEAAKQYQAFS